MVEGGATLLGHFLQEDLWDKMFVETAPVFLEAGVKAPDINLAPSLSLTEVIKRQDHVISVFSRKNQ